MREIARRTRLSFQTVQKYAHKEDWSKEDLSNLEAENYSALQVYLPVIDEWMEADRKIPRKQRHTATRIYAWLRDEKEYPGNSSTVKRYTRKKKLVMKLEAEGYLPLAHPAGNGQVDFGESICYDGKGQEQKGYALTVSFPRSNKGYKSYGQRTRTAC